MKRKLFYNVLGAYLIYLGTSSLIILVLLPWILRTYFPKVSHSVSGPFGSVQRICCLLFAVLFLLSLFPLLVFYLKLYKPLDQISESAFQYMRHGSHSKILYDQDDELGRLTAALSYLTASADNSGDYQRRFISNISHDFRSPLTSIKGYVEAMLDGTIPPEMQERYLKIVLSETERLNKLTADLLLLNTFDDNGLYLELSDFDLSDVIRQTVNTFEILCSKKNLTIRTSLPAAPIMVCADLIRIQQVLYNLIDNAIKFSYPDKEILVSVHEQRKLVFVSVKDYGEGISKDNLAKIWDRFFKTDPSRGRDKKGTGLGLAIVKEIIRSHNQNINVISTEGVGSEFVFTLAKSEHIRKKGTGIAPI